MRVEGYNKWGVLPHLLFILLIVVMLTCDGLTQAKKPYTETAHGFALQIFADRRMRDRDKCLGAFG